MGTLVSILPPTPSPVPGCILTLTLYGRVRARFFLVVFQGRRQCNFSSNAGVNSCLSGGCNGGLQCDSHNGTVRHSVRDSSTPNSHILSFSPSLLSLGAVQGVPPATVAKFTLQGDGNKDFYDGARVTLFLPQRLD